MEINKDEVIKNALAEYFKCDPESISAFALCCERRESNNTSVFSSAWTGLPIYYVLGLVEELKRVVEQQRTAS